jgi:hypothetical protein
VLSDSQIASAQVELRKTLQLAAAGIRVEMFSGAIDFVWHALLEDQDVYEEFSLDCCGMVVGHTEGFGRGAVGFIESYESRWGALPEIWFVGSDGLVRESLLQEYRRSGSLRASWNCRPTHGCKNILDQPPAPKNGPDQQNVPPLPTPTSPRPSQPTTP